MAASDFPVDQAVPPQEPGMPELPPGTEPTKPGDPLVLLGRGLAKKRDEWIRLRRSSGVDKRWVEDLDQYHMKDQANRAASQMMESVEQGFPVVQAHAMPTRSTIFVGITRQKCNAAEARLADILLPTDDRNWGIQPTPLPELVAGLNAPPTEHAIDPETGLPMLDEDTGSPIPQKEYAARVHEEANMAAEAMQAVIDEQLNRCDYNGEVRKMLHDSVTLGTGVMKGPVVENKTRRAWRRGLDKNQNPFYEMVLKKDMSPVSKHRDPRNIIPDPSAGEVIDNGEGIFERDVVTGKQVRELGKQPGYDLNALRTVLLEGPRRSAMYERPQDTPEKDRDVGYLQKSFEIWEYWGNFNKQDAVAAGLATDDMDELDSVSGCVIMINETVVKAFLNPLDDGKFPFDFFQWEKVTGSPWGYGICYLMRAQQKVINSAWRQLMDNLGITAGPQIVIKRGKITPADQVWQITSRKIWYAEEDITDVKDAFTTFEFNSHADELLKVIEFAMKLVDEETAIPMLAQGEKGTAPDTVGGMQMLINSSNVVLRRLVKQFDDDLTRPHIGRYYDYNMLYNAKDEIKGDFSVDARGSSALLVRDIQNQAFLTLLQAGANRTYAIYLDLQKLFMKALQAQHIDPADVMASDAEIYRRQQAQQQQPLAPAVQVAQIRAGVEQQKIQANQQSDQLDHEARAGEAHIDLAYKLQHLQLEKDIAMLTLAAKTNQTLEQIRADLAATVINTNTQKELKAAEMHLQSQASMQNPTPDQGSEPGPFDQSSAPTAPAPGGE